MVGTAGLRAATNSETVLATIEERSGVTVEVISGDEFPEAAAWAREELSLPMFESLSAAETARVSDVCAGLLAGAH